MVPLFVRRCQLSRVSYYFILSLLFIILIIQTGKKSIAFKIKLKLFNFNIILLLIEIKFKLSIKLFFFSE